ncbi:hypothetical protein NECAME_01432, partial [Necator americanus]
MKKKLHTDGFARRTPQSPSDATSRPFERWFKRKGCLRAASLCAASPEFAGTSGLI